MSDIFRTKEVYKKVKTNDRGDKNPIIPVRGVYVVGDWKTPEYRNPNLLISGIETSPLKVVDFTENTIDSNAESIIGIISMNMSDGITVTKYSTDSTDLKLDSIIGTLSMNFDDLKVMKYTQDTQDPKTDSIIGIISMDYTNEYTITVYHRENKQLPGQTCLQIRNIVVDPATIVDG